MTNGKIDDLKERDPELHIVKVELCVDAGTRLEAAIGSLRPAAMRLDSLGDAAAETLSDVRHALELAERAELAVRRLRVRLR